MTATMEKAKPTAERIRDVTGDQPVTSGAKLVKALRVSGTPDAKLQPARDLLQQKGAGTSADVIGAMEAAEVCPATVEKAKALAATGKLPVREAARPIEDRLLESQDEQFGGETQKPAGWKAAPKK